MATAAQVQSELQDWNDAEHGYSQVGDALYDGLYSWREGEVKSFEIASGTVTLVKNHGGGEGDGEERWIVIKVGDQLFEYRGYYSSWDGTEWDDKLREVEPYEVTVIKYREVK
ncbi:hypothetical protein SEA_ATUIN_149 [Arthrobacter phage Atuin]|nr:hypothetical protein SEA_ATUIN_248 [Arthrobacter phage Atuin]